MTGVVVIGLTLADAKAYSDKHALDAQVISPLSFHARYNSLHVGSFFVTPEAFSHPNIHKVILTVQTYMRHQTKVV